MPSSVIRPLKVLIVVLIMGAVGVQLVVPVLAAATADVNPAFAYLVVPYSVTLIAIIACGQVAAAAIWPLLPHVGKESIFTSDAFRWVNVMFYAGGVATLLSAAMTVHLFVVLSVAGTGPGTLRVGMLGMTVATAAFAQVMLVIRGRLRSAVAMRHDPEGVI